MKKDAMKKNKNFDELEYVESPNEILISILPIDEDEFVQP
jgi:hypothetical protein